MEPKEQIRENLDVVDVIGDYLTLKGAGQGSFKALCPFHGEKTPSFHVSRSKQIWRCFGCDKGGDIFSFVMEMEGLEFPQALALLAKKAGVELPKQQRRESGKSARLKAINAFAQAVYGRYLESDAGKEALTYVRERGINEALQMKFGLGFAPKGWTTLVDMAAKKKITPAELMDAGLTLPSKGRSGVIDRFRYRLMIPLRDHHGNVVGFTGRVLDPEDKPKYMNSPQTPIYDKSALLFGLDVAKVAIKTQDAVVIVEGNLDVVASHKAGVEHVVASSGTALTERQIKLLQRYTKRLIFAFDTDAAGLKAARRGMQLASTLGCEVRVAVIDPETGKDPDDVIQQNPAAWQKIVEQHVDKMAFLFERFVGVIGRHDVAAKKRAGDAFLPEVKALADPIEREHWVKRFAEATDTELATVRAAVEGAKGLEEPRRPVPAEEVPAPVTDTSYLDEEPLLTLLIGTACQDAGTMQLVFDRIPEESTAGYQLSPLYTALKGMYSRGIEQSPPKSYFEALRLNIQRETPQFVDPLDQVGLYAERWQVANNPPKGDTTILQDWIAEWLERAKRSKRRHLLTQMKQAEQQNEAELLATLTKEYQALL